LNRQFEVTGSYIATGAVYRSNIKVYVVTTTLQRAVELVAAKYPGIDMWSINHQGRADIIVDSP